MYKLTENFDCNNVIILVKLSQEIEILWDTYESLRIKFVLFDYSFNIAFSSTEQPDVHTEY